MATEHKPLTVDERDDLRLYHETMWGKRANDVLREMTDHDLDIVKLAEYREALRRIVDDVADRRYRWGQGPSFVRAATLLARDKEPNDE